MIVKRRWVLIPLLAILVVVIDRKPPRPVHVAEWVEVDGLELRAVRAGTGDRTLLLLHGFAESLLSFRAILDPLAAAHTVIAVDLPGFGVSDKPDAPYDFESMRKRLADFMALHVPGDSLVVVGHSMGGQLAAGLALDHPDQIAAVVLIAPTGAGLSQLHSAMTGGPALLIGWLNVPIGYLLPIHAPDWLEEPKARRAYDPLGDPMYRVAATRTLEQFDFTALTDRFRDLAQPALLLWGREDPTVPFETGERIAAQIPCGRLVSFDRTMHRPHQTAPQRVVEEINRFLSDPPPCPRGTGTADPAAHGGYPSPSP